MKARRGTQQGSTVFRRAVQRVASAVSATALAGLVAAQAPAQQFLACGVPVTHHLASGSTDTYQTTVSGGLQTVVDATDTGGTLGLLQLTGLDYFCDFPVAPCFQTCTGSLASPNSRIAVSDCIGSNAGDYTVEFNVVQQSPENCGVPLTCGVAPTGTALSVPGEVDAYTFSGVAGQQISLATAATGDSTGSLRLRLYSPTGDSQGDSCSGSLTYDVPSTGMYTVLVSACIAPSTGPYTITWQTLPACPAAAGAGFAYVAYAESNTVGVIDLATNQTVSIVPRMIPKSDIPSGAITTSPNDGLAYVTFGTSGNVSIINTTLNRTVGSLNVPDDSGHSYALHIALDPQGRYAYAPSDVLGGVVVINTTTRKSEAVIPFPFLNGDGFFTPAAVSPDGKFLYVSAVIAQQPLLAVVDTSSRALVARITDQRLDLANVVDISFNPTGTLAYVTAGSGLSVVDTATQSVTQKLPLFLNDITFSRDGATAYGVGCVAAGCAESAVFVIDMSTLAITKTISVQAALGASATALALSPDGGRLVVLNAGAMAAQAQFPAAVVIDTATSQIVATIPAAGDAPFDVAIVSPPTGLCTADDSGQTRVTVGELVSSVNYSVNGCPTVPTTSSP